MQVPFVQQIHAGGGRITVGRHANKAVLSELSYTYPLKLLSPYIQDGTAIVYLLTYGGGLVGGDEVDLTVNVECGARLLLLSQGTTKVFKTRSDKPLASVKANPANPLRDLPLITRQSLDFTVEDRGLLLLLPEPVTCFRDAQYNQFQRFYVRDNGSAVILDWITSGRLALGEDWAFTHYYSLNEIFHNTRRIAKDVMLLDDLVVSTKIPHRSLHERLQPYSCYAMLILLGPQVQSIIKDIKQKYDKISVFKAKSPDPLIWSMSPIDDTGMAVVIRIGGVEAEMVKIWLKDALLGLEAVIGLDALRRAFP